jgi:hypothetical protein
MELNFNAYNVYQKKVIRHLLIIITAFTCCHHLAAQEFSTEDYAFKAANMQFKAKQVIPPSPEAAELGKYGNVPVSLFTGTPKISIPLYELGANKLSLPVSISYNASGFKPQDIATWIGLYWSLNAGGAVTRSAIGNPDIPENYFSKGAVSLPPVNDIYANYDLISQMRKAEWETQPDIYYYNFGNLNGKFFIKPDQTVFKKTKDNLKISHCITCTPGTSTYFIITDEQGNIYEFNEVEISTTTSDPVEAPNDAPPARSTYVYPSTWYLSSITSPDYSEKLVFEYYSAPLEHTQYTNYFQNQSITYSRKTITAGIPSCNQADVSTSSSISSSTPPILKTTRKYLKKISLLRMNSLVSYIDFESAIDQREDLNNADFPGERLLQHVKVYNRHSNNGTSTLVKHFKFNYGYFTNTTYSYKRLKLESLEEVPLNAGTTAKPPHQFDYAAADNIPDYITPGIDHWGFSNGAISNYSLVPDIQIAEFESYGLDANREPNISSAATLLSKITYPTGGYTLFEYEENKAKDEYAPVYTERPIGGVRIKKLTDYSFANKKAVVKNYEYLNEDGTTSGKAAFPEYLTSSTYHHEPEPCLLIDYWTGEFRPQCCPIAVEYDIVNFTVSANSVQGLGSFQGSHIGYTRVVETQTDVDNNIPLGKTVYEYHTEALLQHDDHVGNGDLLRETVFDNNNKLISESTNQYLYFNVGGIGGYFPTANTQQDNRVRACKINYNNNISYEWRTISGNYSEPCIESRIYSTKFYISGYAVTAQDKQLLTQTQKLYDQLSNAYITTVKQYEYGNAMHTFPTKITQTTSNGEVALTEKKYTLDYTIPVSGTLDAATSGIKLLQDMNIIGAEIEMVQYRQNENGTNKRYIGGMLTVYDQYTPSPKDIYRLELSQPLNNFQLSSTNGTFSYSNNYKLMGSFKYDGTGNLIQQSKAKDMPKAYVWDYNGVHPTAEVSNASAESIAYSSFETETTGYWTAIDNLSANRVSSGFSGAYSYNLAGSIGITKTSLLSIRSYVVSYWSKNGPVTVSSNTGGTSLFTGTSHNGWTYYEHTLPQNSTSVTLMASGVNIDELRLHPKDAQMTTYTYELYKGALTSTVTANSKINYFEYDGYYRLMNIKDDDGNIIKNYKYNYGLGTVLNGSTTTLFYNSAFQESFLRNDCPSSSEPHPIVYKVPYGRYVSSVSQEDADAKAVADIDANGQAYANQFGECRYYSEQRQSAPTLRNNCYDKKYGPPTPGMTVVYAVPARRYYSLVSVAAANALAEADVTANTQTYANAEGSCTCMLPNERYMSPTGPCETVDPNYKTYIAVEYYSSNPLSQKYKCFYVYVFSDGSQSPVYHHFSSTTCVNQ